MRRRASPSIWGTAKVGHELTASTGGIRDPDGLPSTFTYQWIRVDGSSESNIASATSSSYTLVAADQGKTIKVKVGFTDSGGSAESLTSDATDTVEAAVTDVCNAPEFGTRRPIWSTTLTVGDAYLPDLLGFYVGQSGALDNAVFSVGGTSYTIAILLIGPEGARAAGLCSCAWSTEKRLPRSTAGRSCCTCATRRFV